MPVVPNARQPGVPARPWESREARPDPTRPRDGASARGAGPGTGFRPLTGGRAVQAALLIRLRKPIAADLHYLITL